MHQGRGLQLELYAESRIVLNKVLKEAESLLTADEKRELEKKYLVLIRNLIGLEAIKSCKERPRTGFRAGTEPGRLGSGGTYVSSSRQGAIAEFIHHNPGVQPEVLKVRYNPGVEAVTNVAPQRYVEKLPLNVDSITAPSVRHISAQNTITYNPVEVLP